MKTIEKNIDEKISNIQTGAPILYQGVLHMVVGAQIFSQSGYVNLVRIIDRRMVSAPAETHVQLVSAEVKWHRY